MSEWRRELDLAATAIAWSQSTFDGVLRTALQLLGWRWSPCSEWIERPDGGRISRQAMEYGLDAEHTAPILRAKGWHDEAYLIEQAWARVPEDVRGIAEAGAAAMEEVIGQLLKPGPRTRDASNDFAWVTLGEENRCQVSRTKPK